MILPHDIICILIAEIIIEEIFIALLVYDAPNAFQLLYFELKSNALSNFPTSDATFMQYLVSLTILNLLPRLLLAQVVLFLLALAAGGNLSAKI